MITVTGLGLLFVAGRDDVGGVQVSVSGTMVAVLSSIAVALLTTVGVIVSSRLSKRAADKGHEIEARAQRHTELRDYAAMIKADLVEAKAANAAQVVDHERREQIQAERCDAALTRAETATHELLRVVNDEIAASAAEVAVEEARRHRTGDHPDTPEGQGPPDRP